MKKIAVGLVQINNSFSGQTYFPYSVGILQAYSQKNLAHPEQYEFKLPIYEVTPIDKAVNLLMDADIVGFSVYVWNFENSLAIAKELKRRKPETVVVFGGPHVPDGHKQFQRVRNGASANIKRQRMHLTEEFHRAYPFIDIGCHGEGEEVFKTILESMAIDGCRERTHIPSISYIDGDGRFIQNKRRERFRDLAAVPSPYLAGVFDPLIKANPKQVWIGMWETDRGCPYQCAYCDWGGAVEDKVSSFVIDQVRGDIEWFSRNKIPYLFLANANFGLLQQDVEIAKALAAAKKKYGYPEAVSVQNAKNPKPHTLEALGILEKAGLNKAAVMSLQSVNEETLQAVRRQNMKLDQYYEIQKRLASEGVYTMTDIIFPMPEETYETVAAGISTVLSRGQHNRIQFNNLSILPNAEMGDPEYQAKYGMELVKTKIINVHGKRNESISGIEEMQDLVVATHSMPRPEWIRTRVLAWITGLIYFNKLLQIPIMVLHKTAGLGYRELLELFTEKQFGVIGNQARFPILNSINSFFHATAKAIQEGKQEEYVHSSEWLDVWWPAEEYVFIKLCREGKLDLFYAEAEQAFAGLLEGTGKRHSADVLNDGIRLNKAVIKLPFQTEDLEVKLSHNVWEFYRATIVGKESPLRGGSYSYFVDRTSEQWLTWDDWYQKMVWYGNRRGAYFYGTKNIGPELAGHH